MTIDAAPQSMCEHPTEWRERWNDGDVCLLCYKRFPTADQIIQRLEESVRRLEALLT